MYIAMWPSIRVMLISGYILIFLEEFLLAPIHSSCGRLLRSFKSGDHRSGRSGSVMQKADTFNIVALAYIG
jgi:hypothetical protein